MSYRWLKELQEDSVRWLKEYDKWKQSKVVATSSVRAVKTSKTDDAKPKQDC